MSDVEFGLHVQAALNMALMSLLKDKVAKSATADLTSGILGRHRMSLRSPYE